MKKFLLPILVLGLMVVALPTLAAEYYVDAQNGSDLNNCSETAPCRDINSTFDHYVVAGDTVNISGDFSMEGLIFDSVVSGTADAYTTLQQWPNQKQAIITVDSGNPVMMIAGTNYFTIKDIYFTGDYADNHGIVINSGSNIELVNNTIYNIGRNAVLIGYIDNVALINNIIYNVSASGEYPAIQSVGDNITIINNVINGSDQASMGILLSSGSEILVANNLFFQDNNSLTLGGDSSQVQIYNNTFFEEGAHQIIKAGGDYSGSNVELKNNIFYLANTTGFIYEFGTEVSGLVSDYNLFYAPNLPHSTIIYNNGTQAIFTEWQAAGNDVSSLNQDPLLTSITSEAEDFHLKETSPAIDAGTVLENVVSDCERDPRYFGEGYDLGIDEYVVLDTPTNLESVAAIITSVLSWDEVLNATSYNIKYGKGASLNGAKVVELTSETNSLEVENLGHGNRYFWSVQAVYTNGDEVYTSDWSETARFITNPKKVNKKNFSIVKKNVYADRAQIRIKSMPERISGFNILVAKKNGQKYKAVKTVKVKNRGQKAYTFAWLSDLAPETRYRIQIKARVKIGNHNYLSSETAARFFTTLAE